MPEYANISVDLQGQVAVIRLNRPSKMNAATPAMFDEFRSALDAIVAMGARALVITGEGKAFCAGADLDGKMFSEGSPGDASRIGLQKHYNPGLIALSALNIPVVTAVNGPAAGIGCTLALSGDLIVAGRSAYFLQAFVNIGLVPDGGSTWLLPRSAGLPAALELMLLGDRMPSERAAQLGLINWCVDDDLVMEKAMEVATRLANGPTVAMGMIRKLARAAQHMSLQEAVHHEAEAQKRAGDTADFAEGVAAFREKRKPQFKGK